MNLKDTSYGKELRKYEPNGTPKYKSTNHERDIETGLDNRGARFSDCETGRFLSVDPLSGKAFDKSSYNYCFGNPICLFDPNGKFPFSIHARCFAPFDFFGGGFSGDGENRKFNTNISSSCRIQSKVKIETNGMKLVENMPKGSYSHGGYNRWEAYSPANVQTEIHHNGDYFSHLSGNNQAATNASNDIDMHSNFSIKVDSKYIGQQDLVIKGNVDGDRFPSAESFVTDIKGTSIFLGISAAGSGPKLGPYEMLPGDNNRPMFSVNISIATDENGEFMGVNTKDKSGYDVTVKPDVWNSNFENLSPK